MKLAHRRLSGCFFVSMEIQDRKSGVAAGHRGHVRLMEKQKLALLAAITVSLIYYVLLISAVVGTFFVFRRNVVPRQKSFVIIAWFFILAAMSVIVTFVGKRYRVSMIDPYLIVLACGAAGVWLTRFAKGQNTTSKYFT